MSDAEEIASEISEEIASSVDNSGSFEGSYQSYRSDNGNKKKGLRGGRPTSYPPIPGAPPLRAEDEYSFSFDDASESNLYKSYSQDFEVDESTFPATTPVTAPPIMSALAVPSITRQLPTMELQALQAEMSLQHLSEEVIQLRNKQRALLKERWNQVKEKKARAEERRNKYQNELNELKQRVMELEGDNKTLSVVNTNLSAELKAARNSIEVLESTNGRTLQLSEAKDENIHDLNQRIEEQLNTIDSLKADIAAQLVAIATTKEEHRAEVTKKDLQMEVLTRSMEASENRIEKLRENLPSYYEQILKEKLERIIANEAETQARLDSQKLDVDRKLNQIEIYRKESMEELYRQRQRMEIEFSEERQHLDRLRLECTSKETRLGMQDAEHRAAADRIMAEAKCIQAGANEALHQVRREEAELSIRQKMLEPILSATEQDREAAKALKREAQTMLEAAEAREASVLASEAGLRARERDAEKIAAEARIVYNKYFNVKAQSDSDVKAISKHKNSILKERFRMHRCSVELASQMDLLRHAVTKVMKLKKSVGGEKYILQHQKFSGHRVVGDENSADSPNAVEDEPGRGVMMLTGGSGDDHVLSAPTLVHCNDLLREFADASVRMRILSEELQMDPFNVAPTEEEESTPPEAFNKTMQLSAINNSSHQDLHLSRDILVAPASAGGTLRSQSAHERFHSKYYSPNDPIYQVFEQTAPLDLRMIVETADAGMVALRAAAAEYGR